ncbi:major facilitator superfamily domain-containing protein [Fusarium redolens]|uniref:Major facilitator superfamily domain-containing protein n=1 Tax=Fusarium redolens TaxID=48865 RepID=A0A9P9JKW0_FUSRE|nr:major facilitator superfamily domain-containing protein [Fusarium redolens]KAH7213339.1 major facilitator superfamily domain-containing protein [Fusarium redolens]
MSSDNSTTTKEKEPEKGLFRYWKPSTTSQPPPDGGLTAWLQVLGSFLINLNNFGLANSFGVFQTYYETTLLRQHSSSAISWIGTLQVSLILIIGVISGPLFDQGHFYPILIASSLMLTIALMMLSLSTQYYQVMLTWGVLGGICTGLLYIPSVAMIPLYFTTRRGLALGCATAGGSFGGVIYPIVVRRLLDSGGFGWACRAIGFIALITLTLAAILIKPSYLHIGFIIMWLGFLVPYILTPSFGLLGLDHPVSEDLAYYMLAVLNASQALGRIIPAAMVDKKILGAESILMFNSVVSGMLALCWIAVHNLGGFTVFLILYGFFSGAVTTLPAFIIPYLCPSLAVIGTRMGIVYGAAGFGALIGPPIALAADEAHGGQHNRAFLGAQLWNGLTILFASCLCVYPLWEARKRKHMKEMADAKAKQDSNGA